MASYLITGAGRGLGLAFMRQALARDPAATVVGLVRDKVKAEIIIAAEPELKNVKLVQGDLSDYASLVKAVEEVSNITGGRLDYLIENAGAMYELKGLTTMDKLADRPEFLEERLLYGFKLNVIGNIHLFHLCLPLIRRSSIKKVLAISTGMASLEYLTKYDSGVSGLHSITKGALNVAIAKLSAQHRHEGILFLSVSPGVVATLDYSSFTEEELQGMAGLVKSVLAFKPDFKGPLSPGKATSDVLAVLEKASFEAGDSGSFLPRWDAN
ncbi:NAD(P)-binding protein [Hypoxylon trugodes]|uniref:NAD(P)-binding protein n=1 Tax=Hypoxylon trugodes TaxID=326681 RepID=UPI002192C78F|nr:NAD(P)-binding protein [Hypoxylon trugodes]KAI1389250.1 NAD(P)-binding protein [Hypoxylon trugodes]